MAWILCAVGLFLILLGITIWKYRLIHLLNNVDATEVINPEKSVRWAGIYLISLGIVFIIFGGIAPSLSKEQILVSILIFLPVNLVFTVLYLVAYRKNTR